VILSDCLPRILSHNIYSGSTQTIIFKSHSHPLEVYKSPLKIIQTLFIVSESFVKFGTPNPAIISFKDFEKVTSEEDSCFKSPSFCHDENILELEYFCLESKENISKVNVCLLSK
jgi:hypothetical protein